MVPRCRRQSRRHSGTVLQCGVGAAGSGRNLYWRGNPRIRTDPADPLEPRTVPAPAGAWTYGRMSPAPGRVSRPIGTARPLRWKGVCGMHNDAFASDAMQRGACKSFSQDRTCGTCSASSTSTTLPSPSPRQLRSRPCRVNSPTQRPFTFHRTMRGALGSLPTPDHRGYFGTPFGFYLLSLPRGL